MFFIINRQDAGKMLAKKLKELDSYNGSNSVVYALPRGGVVLGFEVAKELGLPLDIVITRKIGHPDNPEYAVCAISENGEMICNESEKTFLDSEWLKKEAEKERQEALRRKKVYLSQKSHISAKDKIAIIVDDGIATGLTMFAAVNALKRENPKGIVVAVTVALQDIFMKLKKEAKIVALEVAEQYLGSVGAYYRDFPQVSDEEVIALLRKANK